MRTRKGISLLKKHGLNYGDPIVIKLKESFGFPEPHTIVAELRGPSRRGGICVYYEKPYGDLNMIPFTKIEDFFKPDVSSLIFLIHRRDDLILDMKRKMEEIVKGVEFSY